MQTTVHNAILVIKDVFSCNNAQPDKLYVIPALIELNKEQRIYSANNIVNSSTISYITEFSTFVFGWKARGPPLRTQFFPLNSIHFVKKDCENCYKNNS